MACVFSIFVFAMIVPPVIAHSNLQRLRAKSGEASTPLYSEWNKVRKGYWEGYAGSASYCANAAYCTLEKRPTNHAWGQWYTRNPAAHIDNQNTRPDRPCISNDEYGARGVLKVEQGEAVRATSFQRAEHGGFYRFEIAPSTKDAANRVFDANPLTPWKSLHEDAETRGHWPNRIVGWEVSDIKKYINDMDTVPGQGGDANSVPGPGGRMNTMPQEFDTSKYCQENYDDCFLDDEVEIPKDIPLGPAVLRWIHYSLETPQVFANCVDLEIVPGTKSTPGDGSTGKGDNNGNADSRKTDSDAGIIFISTGAPTVASIWSALSLLTSVILLIY